MKRRADVVGFPNEESIIRLIGAVLLEANDEWQLQHRYMQVEAIGRTRRTCTRPAQPHHRHRGRMTMAPSATPRTSTSLTDVTGDTPWRGRTQPDGSHHPRPQHRLRGEDDGENLDLIEAVSANADNIEYGEMIHVHDATDEGTTAFTHRGIDNLREVLAEIRSWVGGVRQFLVDQECQPETIERIMTSKPKPQPFRTASDGDILSNEWHHQPHRVPHLEHLGAICCGGAAEFIEPTSRHRRPECGH